MTDPDLTDDGYGDPAPVGHNKPPTFEEELREANRDVFLRVEALKASAQKLPAVVNSEADNALIGGFIVDARAVTGAVERAHKAAAAPYKEKAAACDVMFLTRGLTGEVKRMVDVVQALANDYAARKERERRRQLAEEAERLRREEDARAYEAAALKDAGSHTAAEVVESQSEHMGKAADRLEAKAEGKVADVLRTRAEGVTASGRKKWDFEIVDESQIDLNVLRDAIYGHELRQIIQRFVDGGGRECPGLRVYERVIATFR